MTQLNTVLEGESTREKSGGERVSLVALWGKSIPGRGSSRCKGPEVEAGLIDLRNIKEADRGGDGKSL